MDAIEKIKLKGIEYGVGGSKAKLVATGTFDKEAFIEDSSQWIFRLDKPINYDWEATEHKLYYVTIATVGGYAYSFVTTRFTEQHIFVLNFDEDEYIPLICSLSETDLYALKNHGDGTDLESGLLAHVYELPFTLGGNE